MADDDVTPSQPDPSPQASEAPTATNVAVMDPPAPAAEARPADEGAETPPEEQPAESPRLSRETLEAIAELHGDDLMEVLKPRVESEAQSLADRQMQERRHDFTLDTEWQGLNQQYEQAAAEYNTVAREAAELLQQFSTGVDVDPAAIAQKTRTALVRAGDLARITEQKAERVQFRTVDDLFFEQFGGADSPDAKLVITKGASGEDLTVNDVYAGAIEHYHRLANAGANIIAQAEQTGTPITPEQAQQILKARQQALPQLMRNVVSIAMAIAEQKAEKRTLTKAEKQRDAERRLIEDNQLKELAAKGALNGSTPQAPGGTTDLRSDDEILADPTTPIGKLTEIRARQRRAG